MTAWRPTPDGERVRAQRYIDGAWETEIVEYSHLKPGDIIRAVDPDGDVTLVAWEFPVASVTGPPVKAHAHDGMQGYGYCVPIEGYESIEGAIKARAV